jgi:hypothetical membrane protein
MSTSASFRLQLLWAGVAVPVLYFGTQLVIGVVTPEYSFRRQAASDLGAGYSLLATLFNGGAILTGLAAIAAAVGLVFVARRIPFPRVASMTMAAAMVSTGLAAIAAGVFPLPDSRHGGGPIGAGMFLIPFIAALLLWCTQSSLLRGYALINVVAFIACGLVLSGVTPIDQQANGGTIQRLLAITVFGAIGVVSAVVLVVLRNGFVGTGGGVGIPCQGARRA